MNKETVHSHWIWIILGVAIIFIIILLLWLRTIQLPEIGAVDNRNSINNQLSGESTPATPTETSLQEIQNTESVEQEVSSNDVPQPVSQTTTESTNEEYPTFSHPGHTEILFDDELLLSDDQ